MRRVSYIVGFIRIEDYQWFNSGDNSVIPLSTRCFSIALLAVVFFATQSCSAVPKPSESSSKTSGASRSASSGKSSKGKAFDDIIKDSEKIEGLFTLYHNKKKGKTYLAVKPDQLEKLYLCNLTRQAGDAFVLDGGAMAGSFPFELRRVGEKIHFVHKNVYFRADKESAFAKAIENNMPNSLMGSAKIESEPREGDGALLVNASSLFIKDIGWISYITERVGTRFRFDSGNSYFGSLKSFPLNTEIEVMLHYAASRPNIHYTLPDQRSMLVRYHYSLSELPDSDYKPRLADDRIGHFITMFQDYSSMLRETPYVYYVNRWHLEKAEPKFELSEPKKPIVFWLENTIPVEYRDAVRDGVLLWNNAFERIGFKNAIVVKQMPDDADWDPADVRYNTVRWVMHPGGTTAVGPSRANPFTGQIYDADIRVQADWIRFMYLSHDNYADPLSWKSMKHYGEPDLMDSIASELPFMRHEMQCRHADGLCAEMSFGHALLESRGDLVSKGDLEEYIRQYLISLVAHEVGHTLGFRHNFKASTIHAVNELHDTNKTVNGGLTGSVMDYAAINLSPKGQKQGLYHQTTLGPYDYWVVEYAYKTVDPDSEQSEKGMLKDIIQRVSQEGLQYATDEDTFFFSSRGIDPLSNVWDLGSDPMAFYRERVAMSKELWASIPAEFETEGQRYQKLRSVFNYGWRSYTVGALTVSKFIGGIHHNRDHIGDPGGRIPFEIVSAARQREALDFLIDSYLVEDAFSFSPELLNKLAPERLPDYRGSIWRMNRLDYPIRNRVQNVQAITLFSLYNEGRIVRMLDNELRFAAKEKAFTVAEMFEKIDQAVWKEVLTTKGNIDAFRRELQRMHLAILSSWIVSPPDNLPSDALTLARYSLKGLRDSIESASASKGGGLDTYTRAHLEESLAKIDAALDAQIQRGL